MSQNAQRMTRRTALRLALGFFLAILTMEAACAWHLGIHQHEVIAASLIVTSWFRDASMAVVEHMLAALAESVS